MWWNIWLYEMFSVFCEFEGRQFLKTAMNRISTLGDSFSILEILGSAVWGSVVLGSIVEAPPPPQT